jgi:sugar-specific transcriptional regulator TrmB
VAQGTPDAAAPSWAARTSEQATGLRTVDSLVASLARATSVEEVVRVIVQRVEGSGVEIPAVLSSPFNDVVQQLRNEARAEVDRALAEAPVTRPNRMAAPEAAPLQPARTRRARSPGGHRIG